MYIGLSTKRCVYQVKAFWVTSPFISAPYHYQNVNAVGIYRLHTTYNTYPIRKRVLRVEHQLDHN